MNKIPKYQLGLIGIITPLLMALIIVTFPAHAELPDKLILSQGVEYDFDKITEERQFRGSPITKTQGYTTSGDMFFYFAGNNFEKIMLLTDSGWQKAVLIDKPEVESVTEVIPTNSGTELHLLLEQYERVYTKTDYKFFVKTFDKSVYWGDNFQNFDGKISGAKVSTIIIDPNGEIKADIEGYVTHGLYEGTVYVPENLWQRGWYTADIVIEFEGKFYLEQLTFYVYGNPPPPGSGLTCSIEGQSVVDGVCVCPAGQSVVGDACS